MNRILRVGLMLAPFAAILAAQPVISNIRVDDVGHSSFRVLWDSDVSADNQRIHWGPSSSYGKTYYTYSPYYGSSDQGFILSGLASSADISPSRLVHFSVCSHAASGWGCSPDQTVTLDALPTEHPVKAALPALFDPIPEPSAEGCTVQTVSADLSDLQDAVDRAVLNQPAACQIINLPPGARGSVLIAVPPAADSDRVPSQSVSTATGRITLRSTNNKYAEGDRVRVDSDLEDSGAQLPPGLFRGADYCASEISGSPSSMVLKDWPTCTTPVKLGGAGAGAWYIAPFPPRTANWVQIRAASGLPVAPEGMRTDPQWKTDQTPQWIPNGPGLNDLANNSIRFRSFAHHWYIGPGINFINAPSNQTDTTDPQPWSTRITTRSSNSYIAFKRNFITGIGFPERQAHAVKIEGSFIDFSDNYLSGIDFWRPTRRGLVPSLGASKLSVSAGSFNLGIGNCATIPAFEAAPGATASGTAWLTIRPGDCAAVVTTPTPATVTCTGCVVQTGTDFPRNGAGQYTHGLIAECAFSAGKWTSCTNYDDINYAFSQFYNDAIQNIISCGPGPMRISNNFESSHGIFWHLDDSAFSGNCNTPLTVQSDIVFSRNVFATPERYRNGSTDNNGLTYRNRNQWECKRCTRVLLEGNEFYGNYRDIANDGPTILINANTWGAGPQPISPAGDVTIVNNYIHDASNGIVIGGGPPSSHNPPQLGRRLTVANNLIVDLNGYLHAADNGAETTYAAGWCFEIPHGGEDVIVDHNTCYNVGGRAPAILYVISKPVEGLQFSNNALYVHDDKLYRGLLIDWGSYGTGAPNCFLVTGDDGLNCFTSGQHLFGSNLYVPGYLDSAAMAGDSDPLKYTSIWNRNEAVIPSDQMVADRVSRYWPNAAQRNYRLNGPEFTGSSKPGADQDVIEDALGRIKKIAVSRDGAAFTVSFRAPAPSMACSIGYGPSRDVLAWSESAADVAAVNDRSITVSGETAASAAYFQVWCRGTAATPTQALE